MFAYEIVGYAHEGAMYCEEHAPSKESPVFAIDCAADDYCDTCIKQWIDATPPAKRVHGAPPRVYLLPR